jgi:aryl-alcohol dehydrogenase-like predicted oxidoreductase
MKIVQLGSQGMAVSAQGLGCMDMSTTYRPSDEQERAVELGVTLFDTAEVYGPFMNDTLLGKAFEGKRDKVAISTKVGFEFTDNGKLAIADGRPVVNGNPVHIRKAVEGSLGRLKTDYIDLPYLHRIDPNTPIDDTDYMGSDRRQFIVTTLVVVGAAAVRNAPGTPSSKIPISQQRRIDGHFYRPCTSTDRVRDVGRPCPIGR